MKQIIIASIVVLFASIASCKSYRTITQVAPGAYAVEFAQTRFLQGTSRYLSYCRAQGDGSLACVRGEPGGDYSDVGFGASN